MVVSKDLDTLRVLSPSDDMVYLVPLARYGVALPNRVVSVLDAVDAEVCVSDAQRVLRDDFE